MYGNDGISVADALALRNSGNGSSNDAWGANGAWWIIILIILCGWNRNGFGGGYAGDGTACCTPATQQGVTNAFNFNQLDNGIRGLERGMCDGFYSTNNAIKDLLAALQNCCCQTQLGMTQNTSTLSAAITQNDFHNQAGFNSVINQLASCCCDLSREQDAIKYELSQFANNLLVAGDKNTDRIINYLTQSEMDRLRTELQSAQFQLSQLSQTSNIVNQLMPVSKPAYITCSPYASAFGLNNNYNNCGCNTSCCC